MAPKVLIVGSTGMLGSALCSRFPTARRSQRRNRDAPDYFDALEPGADAGALVAGADYVINAAGLTIPEIKSEPDAEAVNAQLPRRLAEACQRAGARLIHVSTDGVFSGRAAPYDESAEPDPVDVYGRTKLAGEAGLALRCSIIGPDPGKGRGLFEWFRRLAPGAAVKGYVDQRWNGVTSFQLADLCRAIVESGAYDEIVRTAPVRHFCPNRPVTKHALLELFNEALGAGIRVEPARSGAPMDRTLASRWTDLIELVGGPADLAVAVKAMVEQTRRHACPPANPS